MSLEARAIAAVVLIVALIAGWWRLTAHFEAKGYQRAQAEYQAAAEAQREAHRSTARRVEEKQAAQAAVRDRFIVTTVKEIRHETANLAACVLAPAAVHRLRDAAACAGEDRSASCGAGDGVRPAE